MSILNTAAASKTARIGVAVSLASAALVGMATTAEAVTTPKLTISPSTGPAATAKVMTLTGKGFMTGTTKNIKKAQFTTATTCGTYDSTLWTIANEGVPVAPATIKTYDVGTVEDSEGTAFSVLSSTKIVLETPAILPSGAMKICLFGADSFPLLAEGTYTAYPAPVVGSLSPTTGSVLGGTELTITGDDFTNASRVTIGGTAVTIKTKTIVSGAGDDTLVITAPSHSSGAAQILVTTEGGASVDDTDTDEDGADTDVNAFTYVNAVTVSPQTGTTAIASSLEVHGVGFEDMDFTDDGTARVFFVNGTYDPTNASGDKTNAEVAECTPVLVVSDTELTCDTPVTSDEAPVDNGAFTVTVVNDESVDANAADEYLQSAVSAASTFTFADF